MKPERTTDSRGGSRGMAHNLDDTRLRNQLRRERDGRIQPASDRDDSPRVNQRTCPHCHLPIADCEC